MGDCLFRLNFSVPVTFQSGLHSSTRGGIQMYRVMPTTPQMSLLSHYGATLLLLHKSSLSLTFAVLDWPLTPSRKRPRRAPVFPGASSGVLVLCSVKLRYRDTFVTRCKCADRISLHPGVNFCSWRLFVEHKYSRNSGGRESASTSQPGFLDDFQRPTMPSGTYLGGIK